MTFRIASYEKNVKTFTQNSVPLAIKKAQTTMAHGEPATSGASSIAHGTQLTQSCRERKKANNRLGCCQSGIHSAKSTKGLGLFGFIQFLDYIPHIWSRSPLFWMRELPDAPP
jgi:hypothetical protein